MVLPIIPILGAAALAWYLSLTQDKKDEANQKVIDLAWNRFGKEVEDLTSHEQEEIENDLLNGD